MNHLYWNVISTSQLTLGLWVKVKGQLTRSHFLCYQITEIQIQIDVFMH